MLAVPAKRPLDAFLEGDRGRPAAEPTELGRIDVLLVDLKRMRCLLNKQITVYEVKLEEMNAQWDAVARRTYNKTKGVE